jgi:hypothetical protein
MKNEDDILDIELELMDEPSKADLKQLADEANWQANVMFIFCVILLVVIAAMAVES